MIKGWIKY